MALYIPPIRHRHHLNPELFLILIGLLLLLLTLFLLNTFERNPNERIAPGSALAATTIMNHKPSAFEIAAQPQAIKGSVAMTVPFVSPQLTATVKTTPLEASLETLLNGSGRTSEIPSGTELLGVSVKNNTVTVNLSEEFANGGGSTSIIERVEEMKKAVTNVNKDYQVKIAINGKLIEYLGGEGLEVN